MADTLPVRRPRSPGGPAISTYSETVLALVRDHAAWAPPLVFALAFGESLVLVSLLLPSTVLLLGAGGLVGTGSLGFWSLWIPAVLGAVLGDWTSYGLGFYFKGDLERHWPLSRYPALLARCHAFFRKWGLFGVFLGRFIGPLRSIMPLIAGACAMPWPAFTTANIASALVWATLVLLPGTLTVRWLL